MYDESHEATQFRHWRDVSRASGDYRGGGRGPGHAHRNGDGYGWRYSASGSTHSHCWNGACASTSSAT